MAPPASDEAGAPQPVPVVPVIDLGLAAQDPESVRCALLDACSRVGVFYVRPPPPLPTTTSTATASPAPAAPAEGGESTAPRDTAALCDALLGEAGAFFREPEAVKREIAFDDSPHWRGYAACGDEVTAGNKDMREQLDYGNEVNPSRYPRDPEAPVYSVIEGPNQWAPSHPELKALVLEYQGVMSRMSDVLAVAMAHALGIPHSEFVQIFRDQPYTRMKVVNYPPRSGTAASFPGAEFGCGPHKDYMLWGFLLQGPCEEAVLQIQSNTDGQWTGVPPVPGTFVCSLGEMLEKATGGMFKATTHQVLMPTKARRMSINWFVGPHLDHSFSSPLPIPAAIRDEWQAKVDHVAFDGRADNRILPVMGDNMLKGMIRSHPTMAQRFHPELWAKYGYSHEAS